jgi:GNAT superfamily N-acetyltransferase
MSEPPLQIRRAVPADAAALAEFAARMFAEAFGPDNRPEDLAAYLASTYGVRQQTAELLDPEVITLIAESGGRWAGFAQVRRSPAPPCVTGESPVELQRFFVDRSWHGRGIAAPFMAAAQEAARELGGRTLWLSVWEKNPRAIAFYAKCGFRNEGEKDYWVGTDCQRDFVLVIGL